MAINKEVTTYGAEYTPASRFTSKSKSVKFTGFKYPFGKAEDGNFLNKNSDVDLIKSNLRQLLLTHRGERVMLPLFGTNLKRYLMEPMDQLLFSRIRKEISESIERYASNVNLLKIVIIPSESKSISGGDGMVIKLFCNLNEDENVTFEVKVEL